MIFLLVEIKKLKKSFYTPTNEIKVLNNLSFNINKGKFISIIGPSGSGKSTLLDIISGLDTNYKGKIIKHKKNIIYSYMFQNDALFDWLTIYENAILGLKIQKKCTKENIDYVISLLKKYGLEDFINKKPNQLSGGMKQRVG